MSEPSDENPKPIGFFKKITSFWNSINNSIKAFSGVLATVIILFTQFDKIKERIYPEISSDAIDLLSQLDTLDGLEIDGVLQKCSNYDLQCFPEILHGCEKLENGHLAQKKGINWIFTTHTKNGSDEVFNICIEHATIFLESEMNQTAESEDIVNGILFYLDLMDLFEDEDQEELDNLWGLMLDKFLSLENLSPLEKRPVENKLNKRIDHES